MPETCTCGAQLLPDSLFCHKCGKAQREIVVPETMEPPAVLEGAAPVLIIPPQAYPPPPRFAMGVSIRNPVALQIALLVGVGAMFLMSFLPLVNWLAAGFFAVFFYRRKTHDALNVGAGLHLGWITGLVMFTVWAIFWTALGVTGRLTSMFQEQMKAMPADPNMQQVADFIGTPAGIVSLLIIGFVFITSLSMAGGAIGAKTFGRN